MLLEAGHVIDGKYRLVRVIGTGGMGAVYEGENVLIRRRVAIKVLHVGAGGDGEAVRRFEREAQAAGEIGNDHILEVLDIGSMPDGDRYLVMELLEGETLASRIERHGHLTPEQISPIAQQFLTALVAAHAAGIIHRDLKPENIFILKSKAGRADFVKLIDFGISKFSRPFEDGGRRMTRADAVLGTPCYMSPEQARGTSDTDVRSDIYSCGVILYEAVTGKLPFEGQTFNDLMFKIALSDAPSPRSLVPTLDPAFAELIERAIARDPGDRFPSAQKFVDAIDGWMAKSGVSSSTQVAPPSPLPAAGATAAGAGIARTAPTLSGGKNESPSDGEDDSLVIETVIEGAGDVHPDLRKTGVEQTWDRSETEAPTLRPPRQRRSIPVLAIASAAALLVVGSAVAFMSRSGPSTPPKVATAAAALPASPLASGSTSVAAAAVIVAPDPWKPATTPVKAHAEASARPAAPSSAAPGAAPERPAQVAHAAAAGPRTPTLKKASAQAKPFDLGY